MIYLKKPLVTIMIPTYNQSLYISRAIDSALGQSYKNIEIIVSDDSTNTVTKNIIHNNYRDKVKYIHHNISKGRVENYHFILYELAKGEWVINLDGDDYFCDNSFIEKAIKSIEKNTDIVLVFSKQIIYNKNLNKEFKTFNKYLKEGVVSGNWLFINSIYKNIEIPHLCSFYKREEAIKVGFYQSDIISSDRESILKLILNHNVVFLDNYTGVWVHHGGNTSQNITEEDFFKNLSLYENLYSFAIENSTICKYNLFLWKSIAKYKSIYSYIIKTINLTKKIKLYKNIFTYNPLLFFLVMLDFRIYLKMSKND